MIIFICKERDYTWYRGCAIPDNLDVEMVWVDGPELNMIRHAFANLPDVRGEAPIKYRGDLAWFIYDNIGLF